MPQGGYGILFQAMGGVRKKSTGRHYRGRTFDEMPRGASRPCHVL